MGKAKWVKQAIGLIAGISIFTIIVYILNYMYMACDDEWGRILWHSFYENTGKIDNLYLGSSHVYCDMDPQKLNQLNGQYNFNLATPTQPMNGTYYLLKEAAQHNNLSHVYVELYYWISTKENFNDDKDPIETAMSYNWKNTDHMRFSLNKLQYMATMSKPEKYPDTLLGFSRYRSHLGDWDYVEMTIQQKKSSDYINYLYHEENDDGVYEEVQQGGRFYSAKVFQGRERLYYQNKILEEHPIAETSETYLRKVITYCQMNDIPITLFISPMYDLQLISTENYDNYLNQVREIAAEYNVDIYDFNLAKEEYLPIQDVKYFRDIGHLSSAGVDLYTEFFHEIMSGNATENKKYFYDTYAQKLAHAAPEVYGIYYRDNMFIASNRNDGMEYKIVMTPEENKEPYLLQDFSENKTFNVTYGEHGICTITYRMKDAPDAVETIEITY